MYGKDLSVCQIIHYNSKPCSRTATHLVYFFDDDIVGLDDNQHLTLDDVRQLYKIDISNVIVKI